MLERAGKNTVGYQYDMTRGNQIANVSITYYIYKTSAKVGLFFLDTKPNI
jgi:hypothetical protein